MKKIKVVVRDVKLSKGCRDGQLRNGKGNKNDEC